MDSEGILESTVEFKLFSIDNASDEELNRKRCEYMECLSPWILNYPWCRESFSLAAPRSQQTRAHLFGRVNFGESIEDEWFIVWLLFQISKNDSSIVIQVRDEDGQFLLIEAANQLPKWLSPDNSDNRVWIYQGVVIIIQQDISKRFSTSDAIKLFASSPKVNNASFFASEQIQSAIDKRMHGYPERIESLKHTTHAKLAYPAAAVLSTAGHSLLLRAAVNTWATFHADPGVTRMWRRQLKANATLFCQSNRDSRNLGSLSDSDRYPRLRTHASDCVLRIYTLSRILYAKLRSLPTPTGVRYPDSSGSSADRLAIELGLKLSAGLDILLMTAKSTSHEQKAHKSWTTDSSASASWMAFLSRLESVGYFRNEVPGSRLHQQLTADAKQFFITHILQDESAQSEDYGSHISPATVLCQRLAEIEHDPTIVPSVEQLRAEEKSLAPPNDESWLYITPDELDDMLIERTGLKPDDSSGPNRDRVRGEADRKKPTSITQVLDQFVGASSSYKGIELGAATSGKKRKSTPIYTDPETLTEDDEDEDSTEESRQWDLISEDSEDGFNESGGVVTSNGVVSAPNGSLSMCDMMRSLISKMDDPFAMHARGTRTDEGTNADQSTQSALSKPMRSAQNRSPLLSSDSSDDELLNLYGPNSDRRADYATFPLSFEDENSASDSIHKQCESWWKKSVPVGSATRSERRTIRDLLPNRTGARVSSSSSSDYSSDDERHVGPVRSNTGGKKNKSIRQVKRDLQNLKKDGDGTVGNGQSALNNFYAQMEQELAGQPANVGRISELTGRNRELHALWKRDNRGLSDRKKRRDNICHARLAQTEEFDSDDSDENLELYADADDQPHPSTSQTSLPREVSDHVMQNLYASVCPPGSEWQPPTGPAAQLFAALGVPVNQLASTRREKEIGNTGSNLPR